MASIIASAAAGGGTYITVASALVASLHSFTLLNTGNSRCLVPGSDQLIHFKIVIQETSISSNDKLRALRY